MLESFEIKSGRFFHGFSKKKSENTKKPRNTDFRWSRFLRSFWNLRGTYPRLRTDSSVHAILKMIAVLLWKSHVEKMKTVNFRQAVWAECRDGCISKLLESYSPDYRLWAAHIYSHFSCSDLLLILSNSVRVQLPVRSVVANWRCSRSNICSLVTAYSGSDIVRKNRKGDFNRNSREFPTSKWTYI